MRLPWIRQILCNLMSRVDDVASCGLSEVVQLANNRMVVQVKVERRCMLESMELHGDLCRDWFHLNIGQLDISNDGINEGTLSKLIGSISHPLDVDSHVISWMSLVFDVQQSGLCQENPSY
jgi:hypothetical protein